MNPEQSDTVEAIESSLRLMNATGVATSSDSFGAQEQLGTASLPDTAHARRSLPQQESRDSGMPPSEAGATASWWLRNEESTRHDHALSATEWRGRKQRRRCAGHCARTTREGFGTKLEPEE